MVSGLTGLELDGWMGLGVALFILWSGVGILKETVDPLLGEAPSEELTDYIGKKVMSYDGVLGTHDLMAVSYTHLYFFPSCRAARKRAGSGWPRKASRNFCTAALRAHTRTRCARPSGRFCPRRSGRRQNGAFDKRQGGTPHGRQTACGHPPRTTGGDRT